MLRCGPSPVTQFDGHAFLPNPAATRRFGCLHPIAAEVIERIGASYDVHPGEAPRKHHADVPGTANCSTCGGSTSIWTAPRSVEEISRLVGHKSTVVTELVYRRQ